jgi:predicted metal-dependent phosphoesterase TrpH
MVTRLRGAGAVVRMEQVQAAAGTGAIGRPHVARAMVEAGVARSVSHAFDRWIGWGRPAFVPKVLPPFVEVADLVHRAGGVVSAAHLKERATRPVLDRLRGEGLDGVETRHPSHDPETRARITELAAATGLLRTGGSDWHGEPTGSGSHGALGGQQVPAEWLDALAQRAAAMGTGGGHYHPGGDG